MSNLTRDAISDLLDDVKDPATGVSPVEAGWVRTVGLDGDRVSVELRAPYPLGERADGIAHEIQDILEADPRISAAVVSMDWKVFAHQVQGELKPIDGIRNIIAVGSGKGGVGKSSTAVNLALALQADGAKVGMLDADIYGPSIPRMLGVSGRPDTRDNRIIPMQAHGMQVMSIGFLIEEDTPMIWRGPMVTSALQQLLSETDWEQLDYLIIDLPPGTGDIQLTLAQKVPVSGAVIVTTPQDIALLDARKALQMFRKVEIDVLGVVENMSTYICPNCGHEDHIFGSEGGVKMSRDFDIPMLGQLPLSLELRESLDRGQPTVISSPDSTLANLFMSFARAVAAQLAQRPRCLELNLPQINIHNT
jgi:ATP-binding protein involved in chromosome partitioning